MTNRTLKTIIILVSLLFLNIEAAHAGLIHMFKEYIMHEFSSSQLIYMCAGLLLFGSLLYIIFAPVLIGREKWSWFHYYTYQPEKSFRRKREAIRRISGILNRAE